MKKSKYQPYFHCFIVCILDLYASWFSFQKNIVTILISALFRGVCVAIIKEEALFRGRRLIQCGYPKVRRFLEGGAYQRKYGNVNGIQSTKKRLKMIRYFKNKLLPLEILFLQETHSLESNEARWRDEFNATFFFFSQGSSNTCGDLMDNFRTILRTI